MIQINVTRAEGDYGFEATDAKGHVVKMDTSPEGGGNNFGVRGDADSGPGSPGYGVGN